MRTVISLMFEAFQYGFMLKAIWVGSLIGLCASFLGIFLVLKRYSLIGDGLAHVSFASVAFALLLGIAPLVVSIPLVVLSSFLILKLNQKAEIHGDAAIGLVSSFSVALGVLISSLAKGFNVDLFSYLFGSILVISRLEVWLSSILALIVLFTIFFFYNHLFAVAYDEDFAKVNGLNTKAMNDLIAVLTSVTVVLGIRVVGTMLISSMIIFPTVTALQVSKGFKTTMLISSVVSVSCVLVGVLASFIWNLPTGATIVLLNALCFILFFAMKKWRER
jgi:ABC-type Mn2+/Zn2+ transport system permease subunit